MCQWIDPSTGQECKFTLQYALDFAHYVDGEFEPVPSSVGATFYRPPISQAQRANSGDRTQSRRFADALFDPFVDDDDELLAHGNDVEHLGASEQTRGTKRSSTFTVVNDEEFSAPLKRRRTALDQDALIVEKLSDDPDLLNRFLQVRQASNSAQNAPTQEADNPPHERLPIRRVTDNKSGQPSKYSFCPRDDQQRVHERITSGKHKAARPPSSIDEVVDNTKVLLTFTREICCSELVELVESIVVFIEETLMRVSWSLAELPSLVYWVNDVLEYFRGAAETEEDMFTVRARYTTEDRLLRDIMFVKVHRQVETIRNNISSASSQAAAESTNAAPREQSTRNSKKKSGFIPRHVLKRLPVQTNPATNETRQLYMRFLSNDGCAGDGDECPHDRAHFIPKQLPDIVKAEIKKRFGGLKSDHKRL